MHSSSRLAIVGAGVAGCTLAAQLVRLGWSAQTIHLLETGRGPGGRATTRRSRKDVSWQIDHGANFFNISYQPAPQLLAPLLEQGWVETWQESISLVDEAWEMNAPDHADGLFQGQLFHGKPRMDQLCAGLLSLAGKDIRLTFDTLVRDVRRRSDRWVLVADGGEILDEVEALIFTGTLLAHPRSRLIFGWPQPPLHVLADKLQDAGLNHALAAIAAQRFEARSSLLMRVAQEEAAHWQGLPFRLLAFTSGAQQRWGLWRLSMQALTDGSYAVVAHSSATFAAEHLGVYGSRSAMARQLGLTPEKHQEQDIILSLEKSLGEVMAPWDIHKASFSEEKQLMRWGAAFPIKPGLPAELSWIDHLNLGFCGDFLAGPGFGRVEGALRSAETLAKRILSSKS